MSWYQSCIMVYCSLDLDPPPKSKAELRYITAHVMITIRWLADNDRLSMEKVTRNYMSINYTCRARVVVGTSTLVQRDSEATEGTCQNHCKDSWVTSTAFIVVSVASVKTYLVTFLVLLPKLCNQWTPSGVDVQDPRNTKPQQNF